MKKTRVVLLALLMVFVTSATTAVGYAQTTDQNEVPSWLTWQALISYLAIGAFFGILHDINDGQGLKGLLPYKTPSGIWDLGIITPAIMGAAAGFVALGAQNIPFLQGLFPYLGTNTVAPGLLAAAFAGYFYSKTLAVLFSYFQTAQQQQTTSPPLQPAAKMSPT
jgi:hypothetical protein